MEKFMQTKNDFSISMVGYLNFLFYFIIAGIISLVFLALDKTSYGYQLLALLFIVLPIIIVGTAYYIRYLYIHVLLFRTYYAIGNKPRFWIFTLFLIIYLIPVIGWFFALVSPFIVQGFIAITDRNKVQQALNLSEPNDFYQFKKLRKALLEQMKQST